VNDLRSDSALPHGDASELTSLKNAAFLSSPSLSVEMPDSGVESTGPGSIAIPALPDPCSTASAPLSVFGEFFSHAADPKHRVAQISSQYAFDTRGLYGTPTSVSTTALP